MRLKSLNMRIASKELPQSPLLQDDIASTHSHLGPVAKSPVEEPLRSMLGKLPSFMPTNGFAEGCRCRLALHTPNSTHQYIHLDTGEYGISSRPAADNTLVLTHIPKMTDGSFKNGQRKDEKHENMALPIRTGSFVRGHIEPYVLDRKIQECLYGVVFRGRGMFTGDTVAIKILQRDKIEENELDRELPETPLAEVFFAPYLHGHPNVSTIREVFEVKTFHCVVSDWAQGEDLLEFLKHHPTGIPDNLVRYFMLQAAQALLFCHSRQVAMHDFSLENCLLFVDSDRYHIRVCDPGQAIRFQIDECGVELPVSYNGCVGKKFRPPEIFTKRPYLASRVDSWCLGWSTFYLLFAVEIIESVFDGDKDPRWAYFLSGRYEELFHDLGVSQRFSPVAKDFILRLMHPKPELRMTMSEALRHPFLSDSGIPSSLTPVQWKETNQCPDIGDGTSNERSLASKLQSCSRFTEKDILLPQTATDACTWKASARQKLSISPIIPEIYFKTYAPMYCLNDKPSGTLIPSEVPSTTDRSMTPSMEWKIRENPLNGASTEKNCCVCPEKSVKCAKCSYHEQKDRCFKARPKTMVRHNETWTIQSPETRSDKQQIQDQKSKEEVAESEKINQTNWGISVRSSSRESEVIPNMTGMETTSTTVLTSTTSCVSSGATSTPRQLIEGRVVQLSNNLLSEPDATSAKKIKRKGAVIIESDLESNLANKGQCIHPTLEATKKLKPSIKLKISNSTKQFHSINSLRMKERQSRSSEEMKPLREMKFSTRASTKYTLAGFREHKTSSDNIILTDVRSNELPEKSRSRSLSTNRQQNTTSFESAPVTMREVGFMKRITSHPENPVRSQTSIMHTSTRKQPFAATAETLTSTRLSSRGIDCNYNAHNIPLCAGQFNSIQAAHRGFLNASLRTRNGGVETKNSSWSSITDKEVSPVMNESLPSFHSTNSNMMANRAQLMPESFRHESFSHGVLMSISEAVRTTDSCAQNMNHAVTYYPMKLADADISNVLSSPKIIARTRLDGSEPASPIIETVPCSIPSASYSGGTSWGQQSHYISPVPYVHLDSCQVSSETLKNDVSLQYRPCLTGTSKRRSLKSFRSTSQHEGVASIVSIQKRKVHTPYKNKVLRQRGRDAVSRMNSSKARHHVDVRNREDINKVDRSCWVMSAAAESTLEQEHQISPPHHHYRDDNMRPRRFSQQAVPSETPSIGLPMLNDNMVTRRLYLKNSSLHEEHKKPISSFASNKNNISNIYQDKNKEQKTTYRVESEQSTIPKASPSQKDRPHQKANVRPLASKQARPIPLVHTFKKRSPLLGAFNCPPPTWLANIFGLSFEVEKPDISRLRFFDVLPMPSKSNTDKSSHQEQLRVKRGTRQHDIDSERHPPDQNTDGKEYLELKSIPPKEDHFQDIMPKLSQYNGMFTDHKKINVSPPQNDQATDHLKGHQSCLVTALHKRTRLCRPAQTMTNISSHGAAFHSTIPSSRPDSRVTCEQQTVKVVGKHRTRSTSPTWKAFGIFRRQPANLVNVHGYNFPKLWIPYRPTSSFDQLSPHERASSAALTTGRSGRKHNSEKEQKQNHNADYLSLAGTSNNFCSNVGPGIGYDTSQVQVDQPIVSPIDSKGPFFNPKRIQPSMPISTDQVWNRDTVQELKRPPSSQQRQQRQQIRSSQYHSGAHPVVQLAPIPARVVVARTIYTHPSQLRYIHYPLFQRNDKR